MFVFEFVSEVFVSLFLFLVCFWGGGEVNERNLALSLTFWMVLFEVSQWGDSLTPMFLVLFDCW